MSQYVLNYDNSMFIKAHMVAAMLEDNLMPTNPFSHMIQWKIFDFLRPILNSSTIGPNDLKFDKEPQCADRHNILSLRTNYSFFLTSMTEILMTSYANHQ